MTQKKKESSQHDGEGSPEHWDDNPPAPTEEPTFWGRQESDPVLKVGELSLNPLGFTIKDLRVADTRTLVVLIGAALLTGVLFFGLP